MILKVNGMDSTYIEKPFRSSNMTAMFLGDTGIYPGQTAFINKNLNYPPDARMKRKEGAVWVKAYINEAGIISKAVISKSVFPSLDSEAIRLVLLMKDLKQDETKGFRSNMWMPVEVLFKLK